MTNTLPLLFAAGLNELVSVLVGLVFLVIWVINQINDAKKKQVAQAERPQPVLPPQPAGQAAAGQAPPTDPLRAQVDDFLRRVGKQPNPVRPAPTAPQPRKPGGRDEVVVLLDDSVAERVRQPLADKMRVQGEAASAARNKPILPPQPPRAKKPTAPKPTGPKPAAPQRATPQRSKSVAEHVAEQVGVATQVFRKEVASLGESVKKADEQFDRQLQQKFDHELGSLSSRPTSRASDEPATPAPPSPAAQIVALLSSPNGAWQAIVLNEILVRPTDRW